RVGVVSVVPNAIRRRIVELPVGADEAAVGALEVEVRIVAGSDDGVLVRVRLIRLCPGRVVPCQIGKVAARRVCNEGPFPLSRYGIECRRYLRRGSGRGVRIAGSEGD